MKKTILRTLAAIAATTIFAGLAAAATPPYAVMATNDLGMHCACPTFDGFLLLPPYNTIRVQVLKKGSDSVSVVSSGITVSYSIAENTDAILKADPYFASWIKNAPKLFPGFAPVNATGNVVGLKGKKLADTMTYDSQSMSWKAEGIPVYPVTTGNATKDVMVDPLGGPNRDPFLTANITVKNSTGAVIGTTSTVVPVAFGGCCGCHLKLAAANGLPATPAGSFALLGTMHAKNSSKINIAMIDPDGDGVGGPVRCSWCHADPAMGETVAPGWPTGTKLLPGATFTLKKSTRSFSDVLHTFHNNSALVKSSYDANISTNCYQCHPGNKVDCYRGAHKAKTAIWCVDCHGNLTQRIAGKQMVTPWQAASLPSCNGPSAGITSAFTCHASLNIPQTTWTSTFGGKYINGRGGMGSKVVLCESCHGSAHAENPSAQALDNVQNSNIHTSLGTTFPSGKDKTYALGSCQVCHTNESNVWSNRVMFGD